MEKSIGRKMSICMGLSLSFFLSLIGNATSGHFTIIGFLLSLVVSVIISLIIGFLIPMGKLGGAASERAGLKRGSLGARCLESLISDVIYTPLITFSMVFMAYNMAMKQSGGQAGLSLPAMFLHSFAICFPIAFVLIFVLSGVFLKRLLRPDAR